jgi:hypothetical protein
VHAASLVLDDLPSMDDAPRRRGRPALHRVHGVATAELAAVALLARAFELAAQAPGMTPAARARVVSELAAAVGASGCCAGQAADLSADPAAMRLDDLEAIHARKTGALFVAAVRCAARSPEEPASLLPGLTLYARNLGLAFQITMTCWTSRDPAEMGRTPVATRTARTCRPSSAPSPPAASSRAPRRAGPRALSPFAAAPRCSGPPARVVRDRRS